MKRRSQSEPWMVTRLHSKGRKLGIPVAGNFELTARCNFNCPMCYVHQSPRQLKASGKQELSAAQWLSLAEQAKDMGMVFALLTGGEPLLRRDFFEIYGGMKQMGLLLSVNSNGSFLSGEVLERFLQDPPTRFNISLYGGSNETYETMCGMRVYDQVKANIAALRRAGVSVSLNLSITPWNRGDLERIYRDAEELDVNIKASSYMYPAARIAEEGLAGGNRLNPQDAAMAGVEWDLLRFDEETFAQRSLNMSLLESEGCPVEEGEGVQCRAGSTSFWITWDGRMTPCGMMTGPVAQPLNSGFADAWQYLLQETKKIRLPAKCSACPDRAICGVCAAVCQSETGSFDQVPEYMCEKAKWMRLLTRQAYERRNGT